MSSLEDAELVEMYRHFQDARRTVLSVSRSFLWVAYIRICKPCSFPRFLFLNPFFQPYFAHSFGVSHMEGVTAQH